MNNKLWVAPDETLRNKIRIVFPEGTKEYKAGTPFSKEGYFANDKNAYGLLQSDVKFPAPGKTTVVTGGYVNVDEVKRNSGVELSTEAKNALSGITFVKDNEKLPSGSGGSVSPGSVAEIVKQEFPGGVGYSSLEQITYSWDVATDPDVDVTVGYGGTTIYELVLIQEGVFDPNGFIGAKLDYSASYSGNPVTISETVTENMIDTAGSVAIIGVEGSAFFILLEDSPSMEGITLDGVAGLYAVKSMQNGSVTFTSSSLSGSVETVHQIDSKYINFPTSTPLIIDTTNLPTNTSGWGSLYNEIDAAWNARKDIYLDLYGSGTELIKASNWHSLFLTCTFYDGGKLKVYVLEAMPSDGGSFKTYEVTLTEVTS